MDKSLNELGEIIQQLQHNPNSVNSNHITLLNLHRAHEGILQKKDEMAK